MPTKRILFVDDLQERFDNFIVGPGRDAEVVWAADLEAAFNAWMDLGPFNEVWLDHDAGMVESPISDKPIFLTFYPFACLIAEVVSAHDVPPHLWCPTIYIHSANPAGVKRMTDRLVAAGVTPIRPDGWTLTGIWGGPDG